MQDVLKPRSPVVLVETVEDSQHLIGDQLRGATTTAEDVETNWLLLVGRIDYHDVVDAVPWHPCQYILDEIAFRVDDDDTSSSVNVLQDEVQHQGRFADACRSQDVQMLKSVFGDSTSGRSSPG